jgi:tetratricopeptide (TPR) repeat protein
VEVKGGSRRTSCLLLSAATLLLLGLWLFGCDGRLDQAQNLEEAGDLAGALAAYDAVLAENAEDVGALSGKAVCLLKLGRYNEALPLQERIVALDPKDVLTRVELGFNYLGHQGRPVDAVRILGEATAIEPSGKNLTFLAQAQVASDDDAEAELTLRRAIEVEPEYGLAYSRLVGLLEQLGRGAEADEVRQESLARGLVITGSE